MPRVSGTTTGALRMLAEGDRVHPTETRGGARRPHYLRPTG
ncbi:hypothetical protein ACIQHU_18335 [Streptomyces tendae]